MKYNFVVQIPSDSPEDYDGMIALEDEFIELLVDVAEVDGHDVGSGTMNIFIFTDSPQEVFEICKLPLESRGMLEQVRIAYRTVDDDDSDYVVLHPKGLTSFSLL